MENSKEIQTRHAIDLARQGKIYEAILLLEEIISQHAEYAPAYEVLGDIYVKMGYPQRAVEPLERAKEINPNSFWARFLLGCAYGRIFLLEEAIDELEVADGLKPNDDEVIRNIGWISCMAGYIVEGRNYLQRSLEIDPKNALAYNDMAASYMYTDDRDLEAAEEWLKKALEIEPEHPFIRETWENLQDMKEREP